MRTSLLESIVGALNNPRGEQARKVAAWIKTSPPTLLHNLPNPDFRLDSNGLPIRWSDYGNRIVPTAGRSTTFSRAASSAMISATCERFIVRRAAMRACITRTPDCAPRC